MPKIRTNFNVVHKPYEYIDSENRLQEDSILEIQGDSATLTIGDSKEGWVTSVALFFELLTSTDEKSKAVRTIHFNYDNVRPKGVKLKTFGGTASGPEPLQDMYEGIRMTLQNEIDPSLAAIDIDEEGFGHVRPVHILDIGNLIGNNVVVGGVRRTAEIFLFDSDDYESMFAKYGMNGIWTEEQLEQHKKVGNMLEKQGIKPVWFDDLTIGTRREGIDHRRMSNNSIAFTRKPERRFLNLVFELMQMEGEPKHNWAR